MHVRQVRVGDMQNTHVLWRIETVTAIHTCPSGPVRGASTCCGGLVSSSASIDTGCNSAIPTCKMKSAYHTYALMVAGTAQAESVRMFRQGDTRQLACHYVPFLSCLLISPNSFQDYIRVGMQWKASLVCYCDNCAKVSSI